MMLTHDQWLELLTPVVSALVIGVGSALALLITGLLGKLQAYLAAKGLAAAAAATASANAVIQPALMTGASTIAGKIARGELDYTDRAQWGAEAAREVGLVQQRVPQMIAIAAPQAASLVASMMAKVDAQMVASPTPLAGQVAAPVPTP